jgi:hypothetical protein
MNFKGYGAAHASGTANASGTAWTDGFARGRVSPFDEHLSENQIDDHLIGSLAAPGAEHLAACGFCVARVREAAAPIEAFKAVTAAWSERQSATLPLHRSMAKSAMFHPRAAWGAAALAIGIAVGVPFAARQPRQATSQAHVTAPAQGQIAATEAGDASGSDQIARDDIARDDIARDNQMLKAIDRELDASVESPAALGLQPVDATAERKAKPPSSVQD